MTVISSDILWVLHARVYVLNFLLVWWDAGSDFRVCWEDYRAGVEWRMFGCLSLCWGLLASWVSFRQRVHVAVVQCLAQAPGEQGMKGEWRERETDREGQRKREHFMCHLQINHPEHCSAPWECPFQYTNKSHTISWKTLLDDPSHL